MSKGCGFISNFPMSKGVWFHKPTVPYEQGCGFISRLFSVSSMAVTVQIEQCHDSEFRVWGTSQY